MKGVPLFVGGHGRARFLEGGGDCLPSGKSRAAPFGLAARDVFPKPPSGSDLLRCWRLAASVFSRLNDAIPTSARKVGTTFHGASRCGKDPSWHDFFKMARLSQATVPRYPGIRVPRYPGTWVLGYPGTRVPRYLGTRAQM